MAQASIAPVGVEDTERVFIASQWQLVWWRFRRHRLALVAVFVVALLYVVAVGAEFLSASDPTDSNKHFTFLPPQQIHWFDDGFNPYVVEVKGERDPLTLKKTYVENAEVKIPIKFFTRGFEYDFLGIIPTDRHILGLGTENAGDRHDLYILGTDKLGRDMWARVVFGTRVSMTIGLVGVVVALFLGVSLGGISGFYGGITDTVIQRVIEILRSLPTIPLWMGLAAAVPKSWSIIQVYFAITIIISVIGWTEMARVVRGRFLSLREEDFVTAAYLAGASEMRIIFRHMVPSFLSHIIAATTLAVPFMIISETALSFLGVGLRDPAISWGVLLQTAQNLETVALYPWLMIPALVVIVAVLALNFAGDGIRDAADPYGT